MYGSASTTPSTTTSRERQTSQLEYPCLAVRTPSTMPNEQPEPLQSAPLAYENSAFLNSPDGRIIRILSEYSEPLARFRRERIRDTVVFFGSARFRALDEAHRELELLENTGSSQPAPEEEQPARQPEIERGTTSELRLRRA